MTGRNQRNGAMLLAGLLGAASLATSANADVIYETDFQTGSTGNEWSDTTVGTTGGPFGLFLGRFGQGTVRLTLGEDDGSSGGGNPGGGGVTNNGGIRPVPGHRGGGYVSPQDGSGPGGLKAYSDATFNIGSGGGDGGGGNPGGGLGAGMYNVTFDLYLFDSWDGRDPTHGVDRFVVEANGQRVFDEALETFEPHENWYGGWEAAGSDGYDPMYRDLIYQDISLNFTVGADGDLIEIDFISQQNQGIVDESWGLDNIRVTQLTGRSVSVPAAPTALALLGGLACGARRRR